MKASIFMKASCSINTIFRINTITTIDTKKKYYLSVMVKRQNIAYVKSSMATSLDIRPAVN